MSKELELEILKSSLKRKNITVFQKFSKPIMFLSSLIIIIISYYIFQEFLNSLFNNFITLLIMICFSIMSGFKIGLFYNSLLVRFDKNYEKYQKGLFKIINKFK
jgi:hypothetical protein